MTISDTRPLLPVSPVITDDQFNLLFTFLLVCIGQQAHFLIPDGGLSGDHMPSVHPYSQQVVTSELYPDPT